MAAPRVLAPGEIAEMSITELEHALQNTTGEESHAIADELIPVSIAWYPPKTPAPLSLADCIADSMASMGLPMPAPEPAALHDW